MEELIKKIEKLAHLTSQTPRASKQSSVTNEMVEVLELYLHSNDDERERIRGGITPIMGKNLLIVSERLALEALEEGEPELLSYSMICQTIEDFQGDARENILRMSIVWHACKKLKLDINTVFEKVMPVASENSLKYINEFLNRDEYMKSPRAMGVEIKKNKKRVEIVEIIPSWAKK